MHVPAFPRVFVVVLDSVGAGALPDADRYGDVGSNTLGNIARSTTLHLPTLTSWGLGALVPTLGKLEGVAAGAYGRMVEVSPGKDSVTGHWELAGVVLSQPFPTYPNGFPADVIRQFEARIGRPTLGNVVASGTTILDHLGDRHVATGYPIVYTSADSVFQIAAHEAVVPVAELYRFCDVAFDLVARGLGVGRVIARPFIGTSGAWVRTSRRHDYALPPPEPTLLDHLADAGHVVHAIGKINDLFAGRGVRAHRPTVSDEDGLEALIDATQSVAEGLIFCNLVDSDQLYGHRNDVSGYARNLERIDVGLCRLRGALRADDLLMVTADHGNDPTTPSTDHSREYVPLLAVGQQVLPGIDLGTRTTFADLGQTVADNFSVPPLRHGTSFLHDLTPPR